MSIVHIQTQVMEARFPPTEGCMKLPTGNSALELTQHSSRPVLLMYLVSQSGPEVTGITFLLRLPDLEDLPVVNNSQQPFTSLGVRCLVEL